MTFLTVKIVRENKVAVLPINSQANSIKITSFFPVVVKIIDIDGRNGMIRSEYRRFLWSKKKEHKHTNPKQNEQNLLRF
jgi:hypothetical protein